MSLPDFHGVSFVVGVGGGFSILLAEKSSQILKAAGDLEGNLQTIAGSTASAHHRHGCMKKQGNPAGRLRSIHLAVVDGWHLVQLLWHRVTLQ